MIESSLDFEVTMIFRVNNAIDRVSLEKYYDFDPKRWMRALLETESIIGVAEDNPELISAEIIEQSESEERFLKDMLKEMKGSKG